MGRSAPATGGPPQAAGTNGPGSGAITVGWRRLPMNAVCRVAQCLVLACVWGLIGSTLAVAQHPHPQPQLKPSQQTTVGDTTTVVTDVSPFPPSHPFLHPPGTNFLPPIYTNVFDGHGKEMPNTLPSTP